MKSAAKERHRSRIQLSIFPLFLSLFAVFPADGRSDPASAGQGKLVTVTYDVGDLVQQSASWRLGLSSGEKTGPDGIEGLVNVILLVNPEAWRGGKEDVSTLQELNGNRLEIRTSAGQQAQVAALLEALRRLADASVVVESELYEVDRAFYDKQVEPVLTKDQPNPNQRFAVSVEDGWVEKLRKQGALGQANKQIIPNGQESPFFSLRNAFTYVARPGDPRSKPEKVFGTAFYGVSFRTSVAISPDRRRVRLGLVEQVTDFRGITRETATDPETGTERTVESPDLLHTSTSATVQVDEGRFLLLPVHFRTLSTKEKDRVLVMLIRPTIRIKAEEEERSKSGHR